MTPWMVEGISVSVRGLVRTQVLPFSVRVSVSMRS